MLRFLFFFFLFFFLKTLKGSLTATSARYSENGTIISESQPLYSLNVKVPQILLNPATFMIWK